MAQTQSDGEKSRGRGRLGSTLMLLVILLLVAIVGGFVWFAGAIPRAEVTLDRSADGIVVLTGGASRVPDAIDLLAEQRGKRLLISGVNPTTTLAELSAVKRDAKALFTCCVDLDRGARNTYGNAVATARWVRSNGFRSLIVVTSAYHMPRALIELERELPDVALIPYPVVTDRMREEHWWSHGPVVRVLLIEYAKYLAALVRVRLESADLNVAGARNS